MCVKFKGMKGIWIVLGFVVVVVVVMMVVVVGWGCERNHAPVISAITCTPDSRSAGTLFTLKAAATDEDGNTLKYRWSCDGGVFTDSINVEQTSWKSPVDGNGKTFIVKVEVSDGKMETFKDYPILLSAPVFGNLKGYAYFTNCTVPVEGATITVDDKTTVTSSTGAFTLTGIPVGSYQLKATKEDFNTATLTVNIQKVFDLKVNVSMTSAVYSSKMSGIVKGQDSLPISGVTVTILNPDETESNLSIVTNATGYYKIWYVPVGMRKVIARKEQSMEFGFDEVMLSVSISGQEYPLDIEMRKYKLSGQFTDWRDKHQYGFKNFGSQTWMTENLAYLPAVSPSASGSEYNKFYYVYGYEGISVDEAKAIDNYSVYGVLYNWNAAMVDCPAGWHLPSETEWKVFLNYLGPEAGYILKSTTYWNDHGNGNNLSGFNGLPGGERQDNGFSNLGNTANFWSTTIESNRIWHRTLNSTDKELRRYADFKRSALSVRCLKD